MPNNHEKAWIQEAIPSIPKNPMDIPNQSAYPKRDLNFSYSKRTGASNKYIGNIRNILPRFFNFRSSFWVFCYLHKSN
jgi:hypothetical protein